MDEKDKTLSRRKFLAGCCVAMGAVAAGATAVPAISAWSMASDLKFGLTEKEVDLAGIAPGELKIEGLTLKRKTLIGEDELVVPVMVLRRKPEWIKADSQAAPFKEPVGADSRYINPEWYVGRAFCTHLGCTPNIIDESTRPVNIVCPCHGGRFDTLGRVLSGPPPLNLYLLPYRFTAADKITLYVGSPKDIAYGSVAEFPKA
jgi:ubiquinol-cytochrome c reductase iron-sulfur subunit